ncbi:MAG: flagellar filament capping protein FliD, partial [Synergistaceae bacterium]|nr:flagellar filament capping protein FliD [Synergistaceae bacterium]
LDASTGVITWTNSTSATAPKHPEGEYTLTYDAFDAIESTDIYSSTGNDVSINVGSGNGKIDGDKLSYEQILKYTSLTSSSSSDDWAKYFTLATTDGTTTYTYGTDYKIVQSDDTDSTSGDHKAKIEWISGGLTPSGDFKLTYGTDGGETISTSVTRDASDTLSTVAYNDIKSSTVTITQGSKTYYEGVDFELSGDSSNVVVTWRSDKKGGYEWYYPNPGSSYTLNVEDSNGTKTTYSGRRANTDTLDMAAKFGMTTAGGTISFEYNGGNSLILDVDGSLGTGHDAIQAEYSVDVTHSDTGFNFRWLTPKLTTHSNLPSMNDELTVEYQYDANTFDLSDDGDGDLLYALGFTKSDGSYDDYTKAQGAEIVLNGETIEVDSNDIGADYDNEIIKGVTLHLKGTGEVTMDISHDAEKAVESIQSFVDNYNDLMTWMNTRMTEKQLDEDTAATVDSDDFRMRWGLLHGNSLLRQTKSQMRSLTSKNFTFTFTQRKSSEEIYGSMAFNGLKTASTLRLRIGSKYVDITIDPSDTLETIVAKLSDDTKNGPMHDFYYDENGQKLQSPLIKASVENDKLEIHSTDNQEITMSGSAAMNALKMNYTYKGLYQIGIESTSDDYGKSGELVFDTDEFMTALEDNPDEVQALMTSFVSEFSAWTSSMLSTSASGETKGTLTREIDNIQSQIDTINEYLERYQERLDRMEENLRTRYGNTETQFSKLSQQANSIAAILNQLNGTASGGGYGQASS